MTHPPEKASELPECRTAFEAWCKELNVTPQKDNAIDHHYNHPLAQAAWNAWQAAWNTRADLSPQPTGEPSSDLSTARIRELETALEQAATAFENIETDTVTGNAKASINLYEYAQEQGDKARAALRSAEKV